MRFHSCASRSDRQTTYLCGLMMVCDQEQAKNENGKGTVSPRWRRAKRSLEKLGGELVPSALPDHRESLVATINRLMDDDLREKGTSPGEAAKILASAWHLLGKTNKEGEAPDPDSKPRRPSFPVQRTPLPEENKAGDSNVQSRGKHGEPTDRCS